MADEVPPPLSDDDKTALAALVRDAVPSWVKDRAFFTTPPAPVDRTNIKRWEDYSERQVSAYETPDPIPEEPIPPPVTAAAAASNEYAFEILVDSIDQDAGTVTVLVVDGEINDTFPSGMTGIDDYFLTLTTAGTEIWAVVTYDVDTLAFTGRSLDFGASVPASTAGTLYIPIGYVNWDIVDGLIANVKAHNRQCGDIVIALVYGSYNAARAIFILRQYVDPIPQPT